MDILSSAQLILGVGCLAVVACIVMSIVEITRMQKHADKAFAIRMKMIDDIQTALKRSGEQFDTLTIYERRQ